MTKSNSRRNAVNMLGWIFNWDRNNGSGHDYRVPDGFEIHHMDRNPYNNSLDNLVVLTKEEHRLVHEEEQIKRRYENGKKSGGRNKKSVKCVETGTIYTSVSDASRQTDIVRQNIKDVCNGYRKTAGGYHWEFVEEEK